jgi:hypothetical protein
MGIAMYDSPKAAHFTVRGIDCDTVAGNNKTLAVRWAAARAVEAAGIRSMIGLSDEQRERINAIVGPDVMLRKRQSETNS